MLEHATNLESMALRLCHDAMQTISATLVGTNTAKVTDQLEGMFSVDLPTRDDVDNKDDDEQAEPVTGEEEGHLTEVGTTTHAAAQSADIVKFTQPPDSSSTTTPKQPAPKIKGQSKCYKDEGPESRWEFEIKPFDEA